MNNPVNILQEEHKLLLSAVDTARHIQQIQDNELYHNMLHDVILFFKNFTEIYHFPKEDKVLYPILKTHTEEETYRQIDDIRNEHEDLELLIAEIVDAYISHDDKTVRVALAHYTDELSRLIDSEEKLLLQSASKILSSEESEEIFNEFTRLDRKDGVIATVRNGYYRVMEQLA